MKWNFSSKGAWSCVGWRARSSARDRWIRQRRRWAWPRRPTAAPDATPPPPSRAAASIPPLPACSWTWHRRTTTPNRTNSNIINYSNSSKEVAAVASVHHRPRHSIITSTIIIIIIIVSFIINNKHSNNSAITAVSCCSPSGKPKTNIRQVKTQIVVQLRFPPTEYTYGRVSTVPDDSSTRSSRFAMFAIRSWRRRFTLRAIPYCLASFRTVSSTSHSFERVSSGWLIG